MVTLTEHHKKAHEGTSMNVPESVSSHQRQPAVVKVEVQPSLNVVRGHVIPLGASWAPSLQFRICFPSDWAFTAMLDLFRRFFISFTRKCTLLVFMDGVCMAEDCGEVTLLP